MTVAVAPLYLTSKIREVEGNVFTVSKKMIPVETWSDIVCYSVSPNTRVQGKSMLPGSWGEPRRKTNGFLEVK